MEISFITIFSIASVVLTLIDFHFGYSAFRKTGLIGRYLGFSGFLAGIITLSYLASASAHDYQLSSVCSSIYFAGIDWMLVALIHFVFLVTNYQKSKFARTVRYCIRIYAVIDTIILFTNIFYELAVHYVKRQAPGLGYMYEIKPLYTMHLIYTYLLVAILLYILIRKCVKTPHQYRNQYYFLIAAVALVIILNAVYLFFDSARPVTQLDFSVAGYSLGMYLLYWTAFDYQRNYMLKSLSMTVFQNIGQGIVLFDYQDTLIMHNKKADKLLTNVDFKDEMPLDEFLNSCAITEDIDGTDKFSIQCDVSISDRQLRCDFSRLKDSSGKVTGNLFVFTDDTNDSDLLTGFHHVQTFRRYAAENPSVFDHPTTVAIFDILGLQEINRTFGREVGDQRIRNLVKIIRKYMPSGTYFIRGYEAHLLAVCSQCNESDIRNNVELIIKECGGTVMYGLNSTSDITSEAAYETESRNVFDAIDTASRAMQVKKLLYNRSASSQTITSLVRALQESDSDTEAHVQRTQKMGTELGHRIGLNDAQLADLSLLCLLHDIGKIGIPLEILNKPGKLTSEEWAVLRSHSEKGFQIAMSSSELKPIAPMILSHHERWDGKGYPEGRAGESIPVLSRVISIVDAYDAMVNNRSYRKGLSPEKAQEEIRNNAGTQFDPDLAEEFLNMLDEMPDIAIGEKTGGEEVRVFQNAISAEAESGSTYPIKFSRYLLDMDDIIIEVDDMFEVLTGYSRSDAIGRMSQYELIPADDRSYYLLQVNNQFAHGSIAFLEHNLQKKDTEVIRVNCHGKRYFDSAAKTFRSEIIIFQETLNSSKAESDHPFFTAS